MDQASPVSLLRSSARRRMQGAVQRIATNATAETKVVNQINWSRKELFFKAPIPMKWDAAKMAAKYPNRKLDGKNGAASALKTKSTGPTKMRRRSFCRHQRD